MEKEAVSSLVELEFELEQKLTRKEKKQLKKEKKKRMNASECHTVIY